MEIYKKSWDFNFHFWESWKLNSPMKSDFNFQFFGIEVGTNPFNLDGLEMAQATPYILELDEVCSIVYF